MGRAQQSQWPGAMWTLVLEFLKQVRQEALEDLLLGLPLPPSQAEGNTGGYLSKLGQRTAWVQADSTSMSPEMPWGASVSGASGPPGLAATGIIGAPRNLKRNNKDHDSHRNCQHSLAQTCRAAGLSITEMPCASSSPFRCPWEGSTTALD